MNLAAVFHQPMSEYCFGLDETHIVYRLRCARGDVRQVTLSYGDTACRVTPIVFTAVEMELVAWDETHDYWEVVVDSPYNRVYYYFTLFGTDGSWIYYYGDEFTQVLVDERSEYFKLPFNHRADIAQVPDWARDALVYNIFPDSFASGQGEITGKGLTTTYQGQPVSSRLGGTLDGVAANASYLKDLGFNCVYLNPIFAAGEYHKYDTLDYFHVDPCFGGDEAFRRMVDTLHGQGIRVIIDGVFNHCGWHFWAFEDVVEKQEQSPYCSWFYGLQFPVERPEDPDAYPTYTTYAYERMMPKLDTANPDVRDYLLRVGVHWVQKFKIDGWRLDVASEVDDGLWRAFRQAVKAANPNALLIGEVWETARHWLAGDMFDSTMNYDFRRHCLRFFAQGSLDAAGFAARCGGMVMRYRQQLTGVQMNLLDSHDVPRFLTLCGGDQKRYRLAVLFQMTFVGMPTVFYGDELGMTGLEELNFRAPMVWDGGDRELAEFFRRLAVLRTRFPALRRGNFRVLFAEGRLFIYQRQLDDSKVTVALNAGDHPAALPEIAGALLWAEGLRGNCLDGWGFSLFQE